ncbi:HNH endonuclease [Rhizobium rhizophilum]|uniref:HNH endonuclease n=1 Tax=Rhizobium rhizophilum TaxID=1850373 RepID=UPI001F348B99|nr:HNH endonuclease [Rhizobium rhizophilum]
MPWRSWYGTERWKKLRRQVWARDHYRCQKTGVLCIGKYPSDNSPVADHKIPHRGDPVLFWDLENIETVSKAYHDSEKQKQERAGLR